MFSHSGVSAGRNQTSGRPSGPQSAGRPEELLWSSEEPCLWQNHGRKQSCCEERGRHSRPAPPAEEDCRRRNTGARHR